MPHWLYVPLAPHLPSRSAYSRGLDAFGIRQARVVRALLGSLYFPSPIRQELPQLPVGLRCNLKPRLDLLLVKDRLQRVQRIRRIPIQRRNRLRHSLACQRPLSFLIADDDGAATDGALGRGTAIAAGRNHRR